MPLRKVVFSEKDNIPKVLPCHEDLERLTINWIGKIYFGLPPRTDFNPDRKDLYKLHLNHENKKYEWFGMWNSNTWTGIKGIHGWDTIQDALISAMESNWIIYQANNDYFKYLIEKMLEDKNE